MGIAAGLAASAVLAVAAVGDGGFVPALDMTFARYASAAAALPNGPVVLYGPSYDGDAYDPSTGSWTATGVVPAARFNAHLFPLPDGGALLVGGDPTDPRAVRYDPATRSWVWGPSLGTSRRFEQAVALADGRILVVGDYGPDATPLASAEIYDPATDVFTPTGSMPRPRAEGSAEQLMDGRVLVAGGVDASGNADPCAVLYTPSSGTFSSGPCFAAATHGRAFPASARLLDGRVLVSGGQTYYQGSTRLAPDADVYDPAANRWTAHTAATRFEHTLTTLDDGRVIAIGGVDDWNGRRLRCDGRCLPRGNGPGPPARSTARRVLGGRAVCAPFEAVYRRAPCPLDAACGSSGAPSALWGGYGEDCGGAQQTGSDRNREAVGVAADDAAAVGREEAGAAGEGSERRTGGT